MFHSLFINMNVKDWVHTGLQYRLELSGHAYFLLFLAHDSLDGRREATGVAGEDQGIAVFAASILLQSAAGIGDGVVVIVCVNDPVVVTYKSRQKDVNLNCLCDTGKECLYTFEEAHRHLTGSWPIPDSS